MPVATVARNTRGSLVIYEQSDIQTPATGAVNGMKAHLISETIGPDQPLQESKVVNNTRNPVDPYQAGLAIKGNMTVQGDPIGIGFYLKWMIGAPTTTGAGPYTHVFKVNATSVLLALTLERIFPDIAQVFRATGVKFDKFSFDASRGSCLEIPIEVIGLNETRFVATLDSAPYEPSKANKLLSGTIVMQEAGVGFALCKKFSSSYTNEMQGMDVIGNNNQFYDVIEGIGRPTGSFEMYVKDGVIFDKGLTVAKSSLKITFTGQDGTSTVEFYWPEVKFMAFAPEIKGGVGPIPVTVAFHAFSDVDASATAMQVTLVNAFPSYASIPA